MNKIARALLSVFLLLGVAHAAVEIDGAVYSQDFDGLTNSLPFHWLASKSGIAAVPTPGTGSIGTGSLYSFGAAGAADRALGAVASGSADPVLFGLIFVNNSGSNVTSCSVSYTGEQWRNSGSANVHTTLFAYASAPAAITSLTSVVDTSILVPTLHFLSPVTGGSAASLDGNVATNRVARSATFNLDPPLAYGACVALFWRDEDETGLDHGLAVDDLTVQWGGFAPPTAPPPEERLLGFWHCNNTNGAGNAILDFGTSVNPTDYRGNLGAASNAAINVWDGLVGANDADDDGFGSFAGNTRNWPSEAGDSAAGGALTVIGMANNGRWFEIRCDRAVTNATLSYATRGSGTGATNHTVQLSSDGGTNWSLVGSQPANRTTTWSTTTFDLGAAFATSLGAGRNRIRLTLDGATSTSGNNRFDNLQLRGAFPPALLTLAGTPAGVGVVSGGGYREVGEAAVIEAAATRPGWRFTRWSDGSREARRTVTVPPAGLSLTATFVAEQGLLILR